MLKDASARGAGACVTHAPLRAEFCDRENTGGENMFCDCKVHIENILISVSLTRAPCFTRKGPRRADWALLPKAKRGTKDKKLTEEIASDFQ